MSASGKVIGSISKTLNTSVFIWRISDCRDEIFEVENGKCLESPTFSFSSVSWYIEMYPNGLEDSFSEECISLFLKNKESDAYKKISYSLVLLFQGIELEERDDPHFFTNGELGWGWCSQLPSKEVFDQWSKGTNCSQQLSVKATLTEKASHEEEEGALPRVRTKGKQILSQNFKDLLLHSDDHDLVLKVKDKELKAHRNIMQSRCPVFKSMLSHDMSENNSGVVEIPDCDPLAFEQFLLHVYTGEVDVLDESTMLGLFYIADKYDMENLKEECLAVIKESLSAPVICDVIKLAVDHSDEVLLKLATKYFLDHSKDILDTVGWITFLKENTVQANVLIKALDKRSMSKD